MTELRNKLLCQISKSQSNKYAWNGPAQGFIQRGKKEK